MEEWFKKTSQSPREVLYPKYCHPRINLSVCYISRWCFPVAFKIFDMQFYPWDVTLWSLYLLTQQIISAWIFSLTSACVRISSAFHHDCATDSVGFWEGLSISSGSHVTGEQSCAGAPQERLRDQVPFHWEAGVGHRAQQWNSTASTAAPWTSWAASWASALTPLTPLCNLWESHR